MPDEELHARALAVAQQLADGSQSAIRWTKYSLNNWLRLAGPTYDTSLALELLGARNRRGLYSQHYCVSLAAGP